MATMWALTRMCVADARRAEELVADLAAWRELRLDPDTALEGFALWERETRETDELPRAA